MNKSEIDYVISRLETTNFPNTKQQKVIKNSTPNCLYIFKNGEKGYLYVNNPILPGEYKEEAEKYFGSVNFFEIFENFKKWPSFMFWSDDHGVNYRYYINMDNVDKILIIEEEKETDVYGYSVPIYLFKFKNKKELSIRIDNSYLFDESLCKKTYTLKTKIEYIKKTCF